MRSRLVRQEHLFFSDRTCVDIGIEVLMELEASHYGRDFGFIRWYLYYHI